MGINCFNHFYSQNVELTAMRQHRDTLTTCTVYADTIQAHTRYTHTHTGERVGLPTPYRSVVVLVQGAMIACSPSNGFLF